MTATQKLGNDSEWAHQCLEFSEHGVATFYETRRAQWFLMPFGLQNYDFYGLDSGVVDQN